MSRIERPSPSDETLARLDWLGLVKQDGTVYGTKLTTLDVQFEDGDDEPVELKDEVEARADQCYARTTDERYGRSLQEVRDKQQADRVPEPVWIVDKLTGERKPEFACKRCSSPTETRTNAHGYFRFESLNPGKYLVGINVPGGPAWASG